VFDHEQDGEEQRKRYRGRKLWDMNVIPEVEQTVHTGRQEERHHDDPIRPLQEPPGDEKASAQQEAAVVIGRRQSPSPRKCQHTLNVESYKQHLLLQAI